MPLIGNLLMRQDHGLLRCFEPVHLHLSSTDMHGVCLETMMTTAWRRN